MAKVIIDGIEYEDFHFIGKLLKKTIFNPFINHILPPQLLKNVLKGSKSELAQESLISPGSWVSMQICYDNRPAKDIIDTIVLKLGSFPVGLRNRKKLATAELTKLIHTYKGKNKILIVGIGAGLAVNALEAMAASDLKNVYGYFVDLDEKTIEPGMEIAANMGLADRVKFIKGNAIHLEQYIPENAHILKLIGIIEYLTDDQVLEILKVGYHNLAEDGSVYTHSIEPVHGIDPFLRKVFNLHLNYRSKDHVISLLNQTGFKIVNVSREPLGIYHMITAKK